MQTDSIEIKRRVKALYRRYGIKSITMDDVAREVGISKKTLYQKISDKSALVEMVVVDELYRINENLTEIKLSTDDAIKQVIEIIGMLAEFLKQYSPAAVHDLKKYYLPIYEKLFKQYFRYFEEALVENINLGKEQGLYRLDSDEQMIAKLLVNRFEGMPQMENLSKEEYTSKDFINKTCNYHVRGIATDKGINLLKMYI